MNFPQNRAQRLENVPEAVPALLLEYGTLTEQELRLIWGMMHISLYVDGVVTIPELHQIIDSIRATDALRAPETTATD